MFAFNNNRISMRCPNCQTINPPQAKFCLECGIRLVVCPNCGTVNLPIAKFCIECGTPLTPGGQHTTPLPQPANNGNAIPAPSPVSASIHPANDAAGYAGPSRYAQAGRRE